MSVAEHPVPSLLTRDLNLPECDGAITAYSLCYTFKGVS